MEDIELHGSLPWGMANEPPWMARRQQPLHPSPKPVVTIDQMQCMAVAWPKQQCKRKSVDGTDLCKLHMNRQTAGRLQRGKVRASVKAEAGEEAVAAAQPAGAPPAAAAAGTAAAAAAAPKQFKRLRKIGVEEAEEARAVQQPAAAEAAEAAAAAPAAAPKQLKKHPDANLDAVWKAHWDRVTNMVAHDSKVMCSLESFVDFTRRSMACQEELGMTFLQTPLGPIGSTEAAVLTWLSWRRHKMALPDDRRMPLGAKRLKDLLSQLRTGLFELGVVDVPHWAKPNDKMPATFARRFAVWKLEEAKHPARKVFRKVVLPFSQVLAYALHHAGLLMEQKEVSDRDLIGCILLLFQAGSNLRSNNLIGDLAWKHVHISPEGNCFVDVLNTKKVSASSSVSEIAKAEVHAYRELDDKLSDLLVREWGVRHLKKNDMNSHFFPRMLASGKLDFVAGMSNKQHNVIVRTCAAFNRFQQNLTLLNCYTSTSIRRANASGPTSEALVRQFREQRHRAQGWASSATPDRHYIQDHDALASGPMFWDIAEINQQYDRMYKTAVVSRCVAMLCTCCGFPFHRGASECSCGACAERARLALTGSIHKVKSNHTCWRAALGAGRRMGGDPCKDVEVLRDRRQAWQSLSCTLEVT